MIATKRDMAPPQSPGKIESTRQRLATLFSGFSPFGSPVKPTPQAPSSHESDVNPDSLSSRSDSRSSETSELAEKMVSCSLDRAEFLDLPDELYVRLPHLLKLAGELIVTGSSTSFPSSQTTINTCKPHLGSIVDSITSLNHQYYGRI
jgi:hypothetical protein